MAKVKFEDTPQEKGASLRVEPNDDLDDKEKNNEDYDEEEDDDYDPNKVRLEGDEQESDDDDDMDKEPVPDYSNIETSITQVKTRSQRIQEDELAKDFKRGIIRTESGLVKATDSGLDLDAMFNDMKSSTSSRDVSGWKKAILHSDSEQSSESPSLVNESNEEQKKPLGDENKIRIESSYLFAGKLITESKLVDANSAEAKAYLNSTNVLTNGSRNNLAVKRSSVSIMRCIPGSESDEPVELKIKLKRPSLIDKFLSTQNNKKQKLSTLEKSRLDWASFVDRKKIKDELSIGNKAGYLDKQDFLGRLQDKRDVHYQKAKDEDRQRRWKLQQQQIQ